MLRKNSITSYAIIVVLAAILILSVNAIAQTKNNKFTSKKQGEKKPVPQKKQIKKTVKPEGLSNSLELSKKIATIEEELSRTKTALLAERQDRDEMYNKINMLTTSMKGLQAVVNEKNTKLVALKDEHEKYNDVITCYRTGLSVWDKQLRLRKLTEQDRLTISTELRSVISRCPSI